MLNLDLSKAIPRTTLSYLTALIPGLFFAISILLGNPEFVGYHLERAQHYIPLRPYLQLAIALFLAFIVGSAFMLLVGLIQYLLCFLRPPCRLLAEEFTRGVFLPLLNWLPTFRFFASRRRFSDLRIRVARRAGDPDQEVHMITKAWHRLAAKLLKDRYAIDLGDLEEEWESFYWWLGDPTDVEWRGPLLSIALEATGWCGLVAVLVAPVLSNRYYLALCALFILLGIHNDWHAAGRRTDPLGLAIGRTRALLRENEKDRQASDNIHKLSEGQDQREP